MSFELVDTDTTSDLGGKPVQYREVEGFESPRFLSYFPHFYSMRGGVATGFHHVTEPPAEDIKRLYRVSLSRVDGRSSLVVREIHPTANSLMEGDVYVFDKGQSILQFNAKAVPGKRDSRRRSLCRVWQTNVKDRPKSQSMVSAV